MKYDNLLGRPFSYGTNDCFSLVRDFYSQNFGLEIPNYARPTLWWDHGLNLFMDAFYENGFRVLNEHPSQWRPGDGILMAIQSKVANHAAVIVEQGRILHHMVNGLSRVEDYRGLYRNTTVAVLRHKDLDLSHRPTEVVSLMELLPDAVRQKLAALNDTGPSQS